MLVGVKNTGKSTLAEYLLNSQGDDCVLLDCDIGRNCCLEGCVSLSSSLGSKKIWIGELTPLNNLQTYLRAIRYLFDYYNENWFTKKLVINTMGYLTGLG
jgi:polynucleotide 5'-kinase involved in rRNA processing